MKHSGQHVIKLMMLGAVLASVGCASQQQVVPVSLGTRGEPNPYYMTPSRLVVESQTVPCRVPESSGLIAWAQAAGGDVYLQRQVDIQGHDRSIHCSLSERAGSYYGQSLPPAPHYHQPRLYYPSYRYRYPY